MNQSVYDRLLFCSKEHCHWMDMSVFVPSMCELHDGRVNKAGKTSWTNPLLLVNISAKKIHLNLTKKITISNFVYHMQQCHSHTSSYMPEVIQKHKKVEINLFWVMTIWTISICGMAITVTLWVANISICVHFSIAIIIFRTSRTAITVSIAVNTIGTVCVANELLRVTQNFLQ